MWAYVAVCFGQCMIRIVPECLSLEGMVACQDSTLSGHSYGRKYLRMNVKRWTNALKTPDGRLVQAKKIALTFHDM